MFSAGATTSTDTASSSPVASSLSSDVKVEKVRVEACGDIDSDDEDDEMEQEEMFVEAYESPSFDHGRAEWGGPRRGGRLPEPTRFGDWERKGRCSDFWVMLPIMQWNAILLDYKVGLYIRGKNKSLS